VWGLFIVTHPAARLWQNSWMLAEKGNSLSRGASPERPVKFLGFARCRLAGRLMFLLLFCFFLGCHEDSSAERFSLGNVSTAGARCLKQTLLIVGIVALIQDIAVPQPRCQYNYCGVSGFSHGAWGNF
jgi:hypothetical protein